MTDNTMREGKLWAFLRDSIHEAYKKLSTTGTSNEYHTMLDSIASKVADDVDARFLQAAQSVPVVERNQCDGCNRGLQVCDDGLHREPSGHPVMACTRNKYTRSIPAAELATLRENAAEADELRKDAERYRWLRDGNDNKKSAACHIAVNCYGLEWDDAIDAAIAKERQS